MILKHVDDLTKTIKINTNWEEQNCQQKIYEIIKFWFQLYENK